MSFRTRLSLVMAFVVFAPLITAGIVLLTRLPVVQADRATSVSQQSSAAAALTLTTQCVAVGDTVRSVSQAVAASASAAASTSGEPDAAVIDRATNEAADTHPGMSIVVLDESKRVIAAGGPSDPSSAAHAATENAAGSCSQGRIPAEAALAESAPVRVRQEGLTKTVATVVAWIPVNDVTVGSLATLLALPQDTELGVTDTLGKLVAASDGDVVGAALEGQAAGDLDQSTAVAPRSVSTTGLSVVAVTTATSSVPIALLVPAFLLACAGVLIAMVVVSRLTRPLAHVADVARQLGKDPAARTGIAGRDEIGTLGASFDAMAGELQVKTEELERQIQVQKQAAQVLEETFAQFGEALGSTHNLDALLEAVLAAGVEGTRATFGSIHVVEGGRLREMAVAPHGEQARRDVRDALIGLRGLADDCYATGAGVSVEEVDGAGVGLAVPLRTRKSLVGVVAVARPAGSTPFESAARDRLTSLARNAGTAIANVRDHEENRRLSVTDALTGTGNLRKLTDTLHHEVDRSARFGRALSVLMLDLDYFKQVNDTFGHDFGDGVLRQFAQRLEGCLRDVDTVARYGGEEFAVILPETDAVGAARVAERVVQAVRSAPFVVGDRSRHVTVSIGVAQFPVDGRTSSEVMRAADAALYHAKRSGRDRWSSATTDTPSKPPMDDAGAARPVPAVTGPSEVAGSDPNTDEGGESPVV